MQTRQIVLRERCAPVANSARRRRFLLGATATGELGIPRFACVVRLAAACGLLVALSARAVWAQTYVTVTVDVDNCAAVYSGTAGGTITAVSSVPTSGPGGGVAYQFLMTPSDEYLYIAAWSDDFGQQGLLAEVSVGGNLVLSGSAAHWEVFATLSDLDSCAPPQPTPASIGTQIAGAVWGPIAVGGPPGSFPPSTCGSAALWNAAGFTAGSNWMWSQPIVFPVPGPFCPGANHGEYLIFRTKIQCVPPPPGMVAWWTLDDSNANLSGIDQPIALDSVPNPVFNHGAHVFLPVFVPAGWVGGALSTGAPGTSAGGGHVRVPSHPKLDITSSGFTVALWYKCDVCSGLSPQSIIRKTGAGGGYTLEVGPGPGGYCWGVGGTNASGSPINDGSCVTSTCSPGSWNHLAMTVTTGQTNIYLNGFLDSGGQGITNGSNNESLLIGTYFPTPCSTELDEVQIWSRALSPIEINDIVKARNGGKCKCEPLADGLGCKATICPDPNDICKPTQLVKDTITNQTTVTQCDCVKLHDCSIVNGNPILCDGSICPFTGTNCPATPTATQNIDDGMCDMTTGLCVGGLNPGAPCTTDLQCPDHIKIMYECCPKDKCRHHCHDVEVSAFCRDTSTLVAELESCNECDLLKQDYTLAFAGAPFVPNRICNGPLLLPTDFTGFTSPVTLQPQCNKFYVTIKMPPTLQKGQVSCYTLTMTDIANGNVFACHGSVKRTNSWCWPTRVGNPTSFQVGETGTVTFEVENTGDEDGVLPYTISVMGPDMTPDMAVVRLNGLPPGTPVEDVLNLQVGQSTTVEVEVEFLQHAPFAFFDLLVLGDEDDDGDASEVMASSGMHSVPAGPGSCCDTLNGVCSEGILAADCAGDQRAWTKDATCAEVVCDPTPGACCDQDVFGTCTVTTVMACDCKKCVWHKLQTCAQIECAHAAIPTISQWGLVVLTLLLLIGAKIYFARRWAATAS